MADSLLAEQWQEIIRQTEVQLIMSPSQFLRTVFLICTILSPVTSVLYGVSAMKTLSYPSSRWLIRIDSEGYLHPNTLLMIPLCSVLYATGRGAPIFLLRASD